MADSSGPDPLSPERRRAVLRQRLDQEKDRRRELEAVLRDALEGMEDMLPYVPEFFREKWEHQGYIDRARKALNG